MLTTSILDSIKKLLGIPEDHTEFDQDILIHINTAFATLKQLGVGPSQGFIVEGKEEQWVAFLGADGDSTFQMVKSFVYVTVRLAFDPPERSYHVTSLENQLTMLGWRLNSAREETEWRDPTVSPSSSVPLD